jgi:hypothetical protein
MGLLGESVEGVSHRVFAPRQQVSVAVKDRDD